MGNAQRAYLFIRNCSMFSQPSNIHLRETVESLLSADTEGGDGGRHEMSLGAAALFALSLILLLFAVASVVEAREGTLVRHPRLRHGAYTLALGVYCTSWTFYGAVGSAARDGWNYLPIYVAPILFLIAAPKFIARLSHAAAEEKAATVSDFIAARFGHDVVVARLVTVIALLGTIPYVALQFRSIGNALSIVSGQAVVGPAMAVAAILLTLFAILFGARRFELAGRSEGLLYAIGLESIIKLTALILVAAVAIGLLLSTDAPTLQRGTELLRRQFQPEQLSLQTGVIFLISIMAIIVLPRQFYMGLAEARDPDDLGRARWGLAAYIAVMAIVVLPITLAGVTLSDATIAPDLYVLHLPAASDHKWVLAIVLLGGVSAAASMAIVDSTALATMVSNDIMFPSIVRTQASLPAGAIGRRMLMVRRLSIMGIMALALAWAMLVSPERSLASIGYVAFAAMAQFTPHLILATLDRNRDALAARASLSVGLLLWLYTLALPPILPTDVMEMLAGTPFDPLRLFSIASAPPLVHGVMWSLGANLAVYALVAARKVKGSPLPRLLGGQGHVSDLVDMVQLTASFVGEARAAAEFPDARRGMPIDRKAAQRAQDLIARVIGASSARALVTSALAGGQMSLSDVTRLLDEGAQSLRFSRQLLAATFENIHSGISVIDAEMNLIAWNSLYLDMFAYPPGMVHVGTPIADLIRYNARHGDFGAGDVEFHVEKRLGHMRRGMIHSFERQRTDGRVIKTIGGPMPGGGYVTSFIDVTEEARIRDELERTLAQLESRVAERTRELSEANRRLALAAQDKTRFLAAASHDLLQPLHAARLFTAALAREAAPPAQTLVERVDKSIIAAEALLRALLDISRLDAGGVTPAPEDIDLAGFLTDLIDNVRPMAEEKGLRLIAGPIGGRLHSDPGLLRSVLQNFLSNAIRYTEEGGVLIGVRRRGPMLRVDVVDSGVGIPADQQEAIFGEFTRIGEVEVEGLGLGLALAERIVRLLGGRIELASAPGRGSRFSLLLPIAESAAPAPAMAYVPLQAGPDSQRPLHILVVDNEPQIVEASQALLRSMGHAVSTASDYAGALAQVGRIDAALVDYRLDNGEDGLTLIAAMRAHRPGLPAALVTAEAMGDVAQEAADHRVELIAKPASPERIADFLARASVAQV